VSVREEGIISVRPPPQCALLRRLLLRSNEPRERFEDGRTRARSGNDDDDDDFGFGRGKAPARWVGRGIAGEGRTVRDDIRG
jgi:hypothetical protein